jgi:YbgC/YbaW family acyl-CoA thioester hydrolase
MESPSASTDHWVEFSETDAAGLVHFSNFFRFMEKAERVLFANAGIPLFSSEANSIGGFPRVQASCQYRRPAAFGDHLQSQLWLEQLRASALHYRYRAWRLSTVEGLKTSENAPVLVAEGSLVTVFSRRDSKTGAISAQLLPDEWREKLTPFIRPSNES